jgi:hypothetical protein
LRDKVFAWAQVQMIGVAENYLRANGFKVVLVERFYGCLGSDRHKTRRFDSAVVGTKASASGVGGWVGGEKGEGGHSF